jgi:hypothetical protein
MILKSKSDYQSHPVILLIFSLLHSINSMRALHNSYFLKEDGLFFSSKAIGLVFSATYLRGSFAPLPASGGISPTDTLQKDSTLTPVTSEKPTLFIGVIKTCPVESPKGGPAEREFHRVNKVS